MDRLPPISVRPTLPVLLHRAVERFSGDDYVVMVDRRISFVDAERASADLAKRLLAAGIGKATRVGILLPTGIDWLVAWLAVARIGALPMLFPATYRAAELRRVLRFSDAAVLLASTTMLGKDQVALLEEAVPSLPGHDGSPLHDPQLPYLRGVWLAGDDLPGWATPLVGAVPEPGVTDALLAAVEAEVSPADLLLAIYTSGSTGDPKAVLHTHGAAIRKVQPELGVSLPGSLPGRTFCAMPFFWVGGPQDLLGALHSGAAIVTQARFDASEALDLLERERCTSIIGWATVLEEIRAVPDFATRDLSALQPPPGGGPALSLPQVTSSRGDPPNIGMTETFGPHANPDWFDYKIVDPATGETLPDGETGEFCVRGFGLMAGLYKQEREETFDTDGYYHTGDCGYLEDGRIWFTGRRGDVIKSRGANVSALEVERVLESFPEVKSAFVVGVPHARDGEMVAAVLLPVGGAALDVEAVRARLHREVSAYKVPRHWQVLTDDQMPWLPSGKPDKVALRRRIELAVAASTTGP
jgi:acyl-CoA synthetase (AMP-forming)/AMP-acid ligase II